MPQRIYLHRTNIKRHPTNTLGIKPMPSCSSQLIYNSPSDSWFVAWFSKGLWQWLSIHFTYIMMENVYNLTYIIYTRHSESWLHSRLVFLTLVATVGIQIGTLAILGYTTSLLHIRFNVQRVFGFFKLELRTVPYFFRFLWAFVSSLERLHGYQQNSRNDMERDRIPYTDTCTINAVSLYACACLSIHPSTHLPIHPPTWMSVYICTTPCQLSRGLGVFDKKIQHINTNIYNLFLPQ